MKDMLDEKERILHTKGKPAFRRAWLGLYPQLSAKCVLKYLGEIDAAYLGGGVQPLGNGQRLLDGFPGVGTSPGIGVGGDQHSSAAGRHGQS